MALGPGCDPAPDHVCIQAPQGHLTKTQLLNPTDCRAVHRKLGPEWRAALFKQFVENLVTVKDDPAIEYRAIVFSE
jgi:hypothetical protein